MKVTAEEFKKNPRKVYRAADIGEVVTINHDHYQDKVFEITARDRNPLSDEQEMIYDRSVFTAGEVVRRLNDELSKKEDDEFTIADIRRIHKGIYEGVKADD